MFSQWHLLYWKNLLIKLINLGSYIGKYLFLKNLASRLFSVLPRSISSIHLILKIGSKYEIHAFPPSNVMNIALQINDRIKALKSVQVASGFSVDMVKKQQQSWTKDWSKRIKGGQVCCFAFHRDSCFNFFFLS